MVGALPNRSGLALGKRLWPSGTCLGPWGWCWGILDMVKALGIHSGLGLGQTWHLRGQGWGPGDPRPGPLPHGLSLSFPGTFCFNASEVTITKPSYEFNATGEPVGWAAQG